MTVLIRANDRATNVPDGPATVIRTTTATGAAAVIIPTIAAFSTAPATRSPPGSVMTRPNGAGARTACAARAAAAGIAIGSPNGIATAAPAQAAVATGTTIAARSPAAARAKAITIAAGGASCWAPENANPAATPVATIAR